MPCTVLVFRALALGVHYPFLIPNRSNFAILAGVSGEGLDGLGAAAGALVYVRVIDFGRRSICFCVAADFYAFTHKQTSAGTRKPGTNAPAA